MLQPLQTTMLTTKASREWTLYTTYWHVYWSAAKHDIGLAIAVTYFAAMKTLVGCKLTLQGCEANGSSTRRRHTCYRYASHQSDSAIHVLQINAHQRCSVLDGLSCRRLDAIHWQIAHWQTLLKCFSITRMTRSVVTPASSAMCVNSYCNKSAVHWIDQESNQYTEASYRWRYQEIFVESRKLFQPRMYIGALVGATPIGILSSLLAPKTTVVRHYLHDDKFSYFDRTTACDVRTVRRHIAHNVLWAIAHSLASRGKNVTKLWRTRDGCGGRWQQWMCDVRSIRDRRDDHGSPRY